MNRLISILLCAFLAASFTACASVKEKFEPMKGPTFNTKGPGKVPLSETVKPPKSKPIVRIIKGSPVEDIEAFRQRLARESRRNRGMRAKLKSLILRDVDVRIVAELLTEICGYNVVATNAVAEYPVTIYLRNLTLRSALEAICRLNNLWYREGQGIITLMTHEEYIMDIQERQSDQTRAFYIRYTNAADMAKVIQSAMGSEVHLEVIKDEKIYGHLDPEEEADVGDGEYEAPELKSADPAALPEAPQENRSESDEPLLAILTVFKRNNCIVARSLDLSLLNEMARIIEALDTPTSQVLLEIRILQVTLNDQFESFFDFKLNEAGSSSTLGLGGTTSLAASTLDYIYNSDELFARISYYEREGRAETIASPFLLAANNSKVKFFVGEETPLRDDVTTTTVPIGDQGATRTTFQVKIVREELGTDVEMTTFVNADGTVTLDFEAEISSAILNYSTITVVNPETGETIEFPLDAKGTNKIESILSAKTGQSVAIGGIIKETLDLTENKVPILGDIPILGFFFKEINKTKKKTETVIVLTPHVIMHPALAGGVSTEFLNRKSSHEQYTRGKDNILQDPEQEDDNKSNISEEILR